MQKRESFLTGTREANIKVMVESMSGEDCSLPPRWYLLLCLLKGMNAVSLYTQKAEGRKGTS
jgi:hypothetical protein